MNTLDDLLAQLDRGQPAGVRGIPADPDLWGIETAEVVFRRRGGLIEAYLRTQDAQPRSGLGPPCPLGRPLAIGPTTELIEAFARTENILMSGLQPIRQPADQFLAMAGAMLSGLTLVALGDCGSFHGLEWRVIDGRPHPVLRSGDQHFDGLIFWITALDGTVQEGEVEYEPNLLFHLPDLATRLRQAWLDA